MEELDLKDLLNYFFKRIPIILIICCIILSLGMIYTITLKEQLYRGDTTLILVKKETNQEIDSALTQNDILLNQKLVATYSEIIKSRRVLKQVIEQLHLDCSVEELSKRVFVSSVNDTEIIKISVDDKDSSKVTRIANTIAEVFRKEVIEIYNLENVSVIDKAEQPKAPYNIEIFKSIIIYTALGFVISITILFCIYYFDTSIKSSDEIEKKLGVPVLGSIPLDGKRVK